MKILHTADWHLGRRLQDFNRIDEQRQVLAEIVRIADREQVDLVLIAGDLFDTFNPPTEAVELFYKTLRELSKGGKRGVVAIAGNHDSAERIEAPHPLAQASGVILCGHPQSVIQPFKLSTGLEVLDAQPGFIALKIPGVDYPVRLLLTPYANEITFKRFLGKDAPDDELRKILAKQWDQLALQYCDNKGVNLAMAHLYFMSHEAPAPEEGDDEKSILHQGGAQAIYSDQIPASIQYTALGHLHRPQIIPGPVPVVYSGSPLSYSFSEADQTKEVVLVEVAPGKEASIVSKNLRSGRRLTKQRFEDVDGALDWLRDHPQWYVELTMVSDTYLSAKVKQQLYQAHQHIVAIIPELTAKAESEMQTSTSVNLDQDMVALFADYYQFKKNQPPHPELIKVLKEIINTPQ